MQIKQILTSNLEDSKAGKIVIFILVLLVALLIIGDQFSIENRCKRKVERLVNQLPAGLKSNSAALEGVQRLEIENCVNESKGL